MTYLMKKNVSTMKVPFAMAWLNTSGGTKPVVSGLPTEQKENKKVLGINAA